MSEIGAPEWTLEILKKIWLREFNSNMDESEIFRGSYKPALRELVKDKVEEIRTFADMAILIYDFNNMTLIDWTQSL